MKEKITKDTIISEAISISPDSAKILFEQGIHCVGCGASGMETISQGLSAHGKSEEEISTLVKEMNDAIPKKISFGKMFITEKAIDSLKKMLSENKEENSVRIAIVNDCGGFGYDFSLVKKAEVGDVTLIEKDLTIHLEKESEKLMVGATLDFVETSQGTGFHIDNPNSPSSCGCESGSCE